MSVTEINADVIAASIALPDDLPPVRVSGAYSATPTAVAKVNTDIKINWANAVPDADIGIPASDMLLWMFRSPMRWLVIYDSNPGHVSFRYIWQRSNVATGSACGLGGSYYPSYAGAGADPTNTYNPHGQFYFSGFDGDKTYIWIDATTTQPATVTFTFNNNPSLANTWVFTLFRWSNGRPLAAAGNTNSVANTTSTTAVITVTISGYYTLQVACLLAGTPARSFTVAHTSTAPTFGHICAPDILNNIQRIQSIKMIASSLDWRNTASYDNAQGDVGGVTVGGGAEWFDIIGAQGYTTLATSYPNGWKSFFGAKGVYAFLKPKDWQDIEMDILSSPSLGTGQTAFGSAGFNLRDTAPFKAFAMSVGTDVGRDTMLRAACHIIYETNDAWADVRLPTAKFEQWNEANKKLALADDIVESVWHIRDALRGILPKRYALLMPVESEDARKNVDPRQESDSRYEVY